MAEHTPTPWAAESEYEDGNPVYIHKDGHGIADCSMGYGVEDDANAAFIVKAVNNHDALVKALAEMVSFYDGLDQAHAPGEAILLDKMSAILADVGGVPK